MDWSIWICVFVASLILIRFLGRKHFVSAMDSAWLHQAEHLLANPHCMVQLKTPLSEEVCRELLNQHFSHGRFRQRVTLHWLWSYWKDDPDFNINRHFIVHPEKYSQAKAEEYLSKLQSTPLSIDRPLWEFHLFPNYYYHASVSKDGISTTPEEHHGSLLLLRFMHCMADGVTLLKCVLNATTDAKPTPEQQVVINSKALSPKPKLPSGSRLVPMLKKSVPTALYLVGMGKDYEGPLHSNRPRQVLDPVAVRWSRHAIPILTLKMIARANDVSVNDVIIAGLCSAFTAHIKTRSFGEAWCHKVRTMLGLMWVSMIPLDLAVRVPPHKIKWGNYLGTVYFRLPLTISDHKARLKAIRAQVQALTTSPEPLIANYLLRFFGAMPRHILRYAMNKLAYKASVSISNVPGPTSPVAFGGQTIDQIFFSVPPVNIIGMFITAFSYCDKVVVGISADAKLLPEPQKILQYFENAIEEMAQAAASSRVISASQSSSP